MVLGIEKKSIPKLQDEQMVRNICRIDDHICIVFVGLKADAHVIVNCDKKSQTVS